MTNRPLRPVGFLFDRIRQKCGKNAAKCGKYGKNTAAAPTPPPVRPQTDEEKILAYVREKGSITFADCIADLEFAGNRARYLLHKLTRCGQLVMKGGRRNARYVLP